jgi:hypothetical protein
MRKNKKEVKQGNKTSKPSRRIESKKLDELIEEAIVDCYNESEQLTGFYTMIEDHLAVPFKTEVLGVEVTVEKVDLTRADEIVAICKRGNVRQAIPIIELPLAEPPPGGFEWIEAYRRWARQATGDTE